MLELYVYGLLSDDENAEILRLTKEHKEVRDEIEAIEKAVIELSAGFAPFISSGVYNRIKSQIETRREEQRPVVNMRRRNWAAYTGWAAALLLLLAAGFFFKLYRETDYRAVDMENEKNKLQESIVNLEIRNKQNESVLSMIRDKNNTIVALAGGDIAPKSAAKVYWNRETLSVYVDAAGLPEPPEGMVYQVWALTLRPLTPVSIGLLDDFTKDQQRIFPLSTTSEADAFGITLEPAGGSESPTMEQLYVFGKV
jgi:anti-sigma-K factor RskA